MIEHHQNPVFRFDLEQLVRCCLVTPKHSFDSAIAYLQSCVLLADSMYFQYLIAKFMKHSVRTNWSAFFRSIELSNQESLGNSECNFERSLVYLRFHAP